LWAPWKQFWQTTETPRPGGGGKHFKKKAMKTTLNRRGSGKVRSPRLARGRGRVTFTETKAVGTTPVEADPTVSTSTAESPQRDILNLYLTEIGQVKLLTPQEEITLARKVKRGDKAARELMIKANLRLVVKIARDYEGLGVPLLDLINEGNIGLMKGVEKFDPRKGAKLSTYTSWWIKQAIMRALAYQSKTIRLPIHVVDKLAHIRKSETKLRELLGREPSDEELGDALQMRAKRVKQYREASRAPVSLDAPLGDDDSTRVAEVVADPNVVLPADRLAGEADVDLVRETLAELPERERAILSMRFGLDNDREETLETVGQKFGVTRERIRQIQEIALKKMRASMEKRENPDAEEKREIAMAA